ncbi:MAG: HupE/UreJ family protein [Opitutae bacterium]
MKLFCTQLVSLLCVVCNFFVSSLAAHPIPDLPIFGKFDENGSSQIEVEIDPRAFSDDPEAEPFLTVSALDELNASSRQDLLDQAIELLECSLEIRINAQDWYLPDFDYEFVETINMDENNETIIFIRAHSQISRENNASYQIRAMETAALDLIFTNQINGTPHRRVNVLFPGEESFVLPLPALENQTGSSENPLDDFSSSPSGGFHSNHSLSTLLSFARQGFVHVLPLGVDHILFVLGIFLLSRKWKPLVLQVSAFTLAHTITLGMATMGWVSVPSSIVEPIIAGSIAFVALENIFFPTYNPRRLIIVFLFGLIHGLGFAGALSELRLEPSILIISLIGFNLGVEGGQLAVILLAFLGVYRFNDEQKYRRSVVIPVSLAIAGLGVYWMIERILY